MFCKLRCEELSVMYILIHAQRKHPRLILLSSACWTKTCFQIANDVLVFRWLGSEKHVLNETRSTTSFCCALCPFACHPCELCPLCHPCVSFGPCATPVSCAPCATPVWAVPPVPWIKGRYAVIGRNICDVANICCAVVACCPGAGRSAPPVLRAEVSSSHGKYWQAHKAI